LKTDKLGRVKTPQAIATVTQRAGSSGPSMAFIDFAELCSRDRDREPWLSG
jgi:hypothetical protein